MSSVTNDEKLIKEIQILKKQVANLEAELGDLSSVKDFFEKENISPTDSICQCQKCGHKLGIYDKKSDELRIRYRELALYVTIGKGGNIKIICKNCSHIQQFNYID